MKNSAVLIPLFLIFAIACKEKPSSNKKNDSTPQPPKTTKKLLGPIKDHTIVYTLQNTKQWLLNHDTDYRQKEIAYAINRTDKSYFALMDSVLIPNHFNAPLADYLPFPLFVNYLESVHKIIYFSYPTQTFAAYEKGKLIYTGPTNMGRAIHLTPTGLFFTNWKAKVTTSTVNDEWILNWNFNIINSEGIGWHQYSLPGFPTSHSCLRLQKKDAQYLYNWADQWILADEYTIQANGTPVIIFGNYNFRLPKPWLQLIANSQSLEITEKEILLITQPFMPKILASQLNSDTILLNKNFKTKDSI
jgi:lipoprotein-anchoring transpeptidase ErfK/SrfK